MAEILAVLGTLGSSISGGLASAGASLGGVAGTLGTALTVGSTVYSGIRANQNAKAEAKGLKKQGDDQYAIAQREAMKHRKERDLVISRQRAVAAASGGSTGDATVQAIMGRTDAEGEYNAMIDMYNGATSRADLYGAAKSKVKEGKSALLGSFIDAGTTIYGDVSKRRRMNAAYSA
jgi:hypothetical protein